MSDFFKLLQEAEIVSLEMEQAKMALDASKEAMEQAKEDYEDARKALEKVLFKADEMAIPRQRIRKLIEDRTQALINSGLMVVEAKSSKASKKAAKKSPKPKNLDPSAGKESQPAELN